MGPTPHLADQLLVDLALSKEQVKNFPLPDAQQPVRVQRREADEPAIGTMNPIGRDYMNVRMVVCKVAKRLNAGNRAGQNVVASEHAPIDFHNRLPRRAGEPTQEPPTVAEKDAQPLRDRPYDLPMGDRLADILRNPLGQQKRPLLMATGTKTPLLTREGHEHLVRTTGALDTGESEVEVSAAEKIAGYLADDGPPASVALLITLAIGAFELGIVALDKPVQR